MEFIIDKLPDLEILRISVSGTLNQNTRGKSLSEVL